MDMAGIHCYDDNSSHSLFHSSAEEMIHIQMDGIPDLILLDFKCRSFFLKSLVQLEMILLVTMIRKEREI